MSLRRFFCKSVQNFAFAATLLCLIGMSASSLRAQTSKPKTIKAAAVGPVRLPDPHIPGFVYPEPQAVILRHVNANDQAWITKHAWGIWTALTIPTKPGGRPLVYETWLSPIPGGVMSPGTMAGAEGGLPPQVFHLLQRPRQFHGRKFAKNIANGTPTTSDQVLVTVNWSPEMVAEVQAKQLQSSTALNKLLTGGITSITLNKRSISLKPTYLWLNPAWMVQGRYFQVSTWPGPTGGGIAFPSNLWNQCVLGGRATIWNRNRHRSYGYHLRGGR